MSNATKFVVGQTYSARSACDSECIFKFEIVRRTAKFVFVKELGMVSRRGIRLDGDGVETCMPCGVFSMAPVIRADRTA